MSEMSPFSRVQGVCSSYETEAVYGLGLLGKASAGIWQS